MKETPMQESEVMSRFATRYFDYNATRPMNAESLIKSAYESLEAEEKPKGVKGKAMPQPSE
jgi:hypothetical protein